MKYSILSKIRFYVLLIYYKIIAPLECQNYRLKVFINECTFPFHTLTGFRKLKSEHSTTILLRTNLGNYYIRNIGVDLNIASPAFERLDIQELVRRISCSLARNRHVIFIDIGAQFGIYTITVGNRFRRSSKNLTIFAFEPDPENFALLEKNVRLNKLSNVNTFKTALSDKVSTQRFYYFEPMKQIVSFPTSTTIRIQTQKLDTFTRRSDLKNSDVYIKLDVEGHEIKVLEGAASTIRNARSVTLIVEDCMQATSKQLLRYLKNHGVFLKKISTMNSFWSLR